MAIFRVGSRGMGKVVFDRATMPVTETTRRTGVNTAKALGRPKPAVIGTGKVEGIPVYGQTAVVTRKPGFSDPWVSPDFFAPVDLTTTVSVTVGYLLAHDYFGQGYELIRLEIDDVVVFDAENGAIPSVGFRFYNGLQTAVDPLVSTIVGENAGAHTGDVLIFLVDYPSTQAPNVAAVISNAATESGGTAELSWIGETPVNLNNTLRSAYDPVAGILYQVFTHTEISTLTQCWLSVLDVDTDTELYRVPLEDSSPYINGQVFLMPLAGSGHICIRMAIPSEATSPTYVYDAQTGSIVAQFIEEADESVIWRAAQPFGDLWLMVGGDADGSGGLSTLCAVIDLALGTFDVTRDDAGIGSVFSVGRSLDGSASFFGYGSSVVSELTFDGQSWSSRTAYTPVGSVNAIHYDPLTEYLVVFEIVSDNLIELVAPDTGAVVDSFTVSTTMFPLIDNQTGARGFPRNGFMLLMDASENVWSIDIQNKTATILADVDGETGHEADHGIYDHARLAYFMAYGETVWTKYQVPGTNPGEITLESHITSLLTHLGPYTVDEIRFDGFSGLTSWGHVIDRDSNIKSILRSYQDPFGFTWSDIGSEIYFRRPLTDSSFSSDETILDADLVFKTGGSIVSDDTSDISRTARVTLEYISKDDNYETRTASADSFSALYEVTRSTKEEQLSTSLVLSDADAEQMVQEALWRRQINARVHRFSTYADFIKLVPGDVVTVPSDAITYTVQVTKVNIRENMVIDFEVKDFQTSLAADVAAVTNTGFSGISTITLQTQYIHLDIPLFRYSDDAGGSALIQYGELVSRGQPNWSGGILYRGDTAQSQEFLTDQAPHVGFIGICISVLPNMPSDHSGDFTNTVTVQRIAGDAPTAATESEVLLGSNLAFIGAQGRWEGIGFTTITDNDNGTYTISGFAVRGYRGTEVHAGNHATGDLFVLIKADWLLKMSHPLTDLAENKFYRAVGIGASKESGTLIKHEISGAAEKPYAVVNAEGVLDGSDTLISFNYRSRLSAWEMFETSPDCGEDSLSFEIDIIDNDSPGSVVRTLTSATNSATYTAAQKTTDFGTPPSETTAKIYMISAAVERGHVAEVTIPL